MPTTFCSSTLVNVSRIESIRIFCGPEDIERIINTFRQRESIEKFSHVAALSEVQENDYNLNIPRYVDTFDAEEPVDLDDVSKKLVILENEMGETDKVIAGFCKELGIKAPF